MKLLRLILIAVVWIAGESAEGAPARFWISDQDESPIIGEAPQIDAAQGIQRKLFIWGQPATVGAGPYHPTSNPFRTLTDFSLNVVTVPEGAPFVDFENLTFKVYNDVVVNPDKRRFEYTFDSETPTGQDGPLESDYDGAEIMPGQPDAIRRLKGLTIFSNTVVGLGHFNDPHHRLASGGAHAWRIAEFSFTALQTSGVNNLFLQIGTAGMRHQGDDLDPPQGTPECTLETCVVFGTNDTVTYHASGMSHRGVTLPNDTYDIRINAIAPISGDFNGDGTIGPEDYPYWLEQFGDDVPPGTGPDATNDGHVNILDYIFWAKSTSSSGGASTAVPEPTFGALASVCLMLLLPAIHRRRGVRKSQ